MEYKSQRLPLPMIEEESPAAEAPSASATAATAPLSPEELEKKIVEVLRTCYDPEIPVDIYELGLIYKIVIEAAGAVTVRMTLTSPSCPAAGSLPGDVQRKTASVAGVTSAKVDLVWDPPWEPGRMSEAAKLQLGMD